MKLQKVTEGVPAAPKRRYDDACGTAHALDLIGERWALLIVRELLLGPKRFTDLRRGLPGASQSVLTQRLAELEQAGVLRRRELGPPASTRAWELTEQGRELEPVLVRLSAWGSRTPAGSAAELSVDALALAMRTTFDPARAGDLRLRCELRLGGDVLRLVVEDGTLEVARGDLDRPGAVVETTSAGWRAAIFAGAGSGALTVRGDRRAVSRLLKVFPRPATR
jgi:DNA-binding HxlR family transcriptional regulator